MAIKAEMVAPKVKRNVTLTLDEEEAGLLAHYIEANGLWHRDKGGQVAQDVFYALEGAGVEVA